VRTLVLTTQLLLVFIEFPQTIPCPEWVGHVSAAPLSLGSHMEALYSRSTARTHWPCA
jgi:hypothetical protein